MLRRLCWILLAFCWACAGTSPGGQGADAGGVFDGGAIPDGSPGAVDAASKELHGECGMPTYTWLPATHMGDIVEDDANGALTKAEETTVEVALADKGLVLKRFPQYKTQLHRILYRTQDRGKTINATGMVVIPQLGSPQEMPVLLFLHGTTGANDSCAPSANVDDITSANYQASLLLSLFASFGYIVVAPDYIGLKSLGTPSPELHPYLVAEPTAIASLDSVRAAIKLLGQLGSNATPGRVAVWGGSQGGHAAGFTVRYAPTYAPELDIAAGVFAMPPLNLVAHWRKALETIGPATHFIGMAYAAMAPWYHTPPLSQVYAQPYDQTIPQALATDCHPSTFNSITSLDQIFTPQLLASIPTLGMNDFQPWSCIADANSLPTTSVPRLKNVPSLIILGEKDQIVDPSIERADFRDMCAKGSNWSYLECTGAGHAETFAWSIDDALDFIQARLAGDPVTDACTVHPAQTCQDTPSP